jgi:hypothetical protein
MTGRDSVFGRGLEEESAFGSGFELSSFEITDMERCAFVVFFFLCCTKGLYHLERRVTTLLTLGVELSSFQISLEFMNFKGGRAACHMLHKWVISF